MFGIPLGPYSIAAGSDTRPTNTPEDMSALMKAYADIRARNATPQGRINRGFAQFGPQPSGPVAPMLPTPQMPGPVDMGPPALSAQAQSQGPSPAPPVPAAGPTSVGGAPLQTASVAPTPADTGQAANIPIGLNYSMPAFGTPSNTQPSGPDVINKLLSYFHGKGTNY